MYILIFSVPDYRLLESLEYKAWRCKNVLQAFLCTNFGGSVYLYMRIKKRRIKPFAKNWFLPPKTAIYYCKVFQGPANKAAEAHDFDFWQKCQFMLCLKPEIPGTERFIQSLYSKQFFITGYSSYHKAT